MKFVITAICFFILYSTSAQEFDFSADTTQGCSPLKVKFINTTDQAIRESYSYEWIVEQGKYSTETDTVQNTYLSPGTYSVNMNVYDGKTLVKTITKSNYITVFNDPDVTITSDKIATCENKPFQFSIESITADTNIVSYTWVLSDGSIYLTEVPPAHTFGFADDFTVFLSIQDAHGCSNRIRKSISVKTYDDYPSISFLASPTKTCEPTLDVSFMNMSEGEIQSYYWDFGDGSDYSGENPPTHRYTGFGTYYARLTASSLHDCEMISARAIKLIDYQPEIQISDEFAPVVFDTENYDTYLEQDSLSTCPCKQVDAKKDIKIITDDNKACIGTITFKDITPSDDNITWEWDFNGDGTIESENPTFTIDILESGTYTIKLKTSNGLCTKETTRTFTVEEPLDIAVEPSELFYCYAPVTVTYKATSNLAGTNFLWKFSDASTSLYLGDTYSITYTNEGAYENKLYAISPNYCRYSKVTDKSIEITKPTLSDYIIGAPISGCNPLTVTFPTGYFYNTNQDSIKSITWQYANSTQDSTTQIFEKKSKNGVINQEYTYDEVGVFTPYIRLETHKGCIDTDTLNGARAIKVGETPNVTINYVTDIMCASDQAIVMVTYNDNKNKYSSINDTIFIYNYADENHTSPYMSTPVKDILQFSITDTTGLHTSSYIISDNGCRQTVNDNHVMNVLGPIIELTASEKDCSNPLVYDVTLKKAIDVTQNEWFIIQGTDYNNPISIATDVSSVHIDFADYGGRGEYYVRVTAKNTETNCEMNDSIRFVVTDIKGAFGLEQTTYCLNSYAKFIVSPYMGQDITSWEWLYDWNDVKKSAVFARIDNGQIIRNDVEYTVLKYDDCENKYVTVTYPPSEEYLYRLDTSNITSITVIAKDIYGCPDTVSKAISIASPTAGFFGDITSDCIPFTTKFTDTTNSSNTIVQREWIVDGKKISNTNETTISTTSNTAGYKTIQLIITDELGCRDTAMKIDYIKPIVPNSLFTVKNPRVCFGKEATFIKDTKTLGYDNNITHFTWDFGDGTIKNGNGNPDNTTTYLYENESKKDYTVKLIAYSTSPEGHECVDSTERTVDIKKVGANIVIKDTDLCKEPGQKFIVYLDNSIYSSNITYYNWWKYDNGDSIYVSNKRNLQVVTFDNYGDQSIYLQTKSSYYGCEDTTMNVIIHVPGYEVSMFAEKDQACIKEDILFYLEDTLNLYRYKAYWEFGDGISVPMDGLQTSHAYNTLAATDDNSYKVQFIVDAPGCRPRDISTNITIFPVQAKFTRGIEDLDTIACAPYEVTLYNTSIAGENASYLWNFSNGSTSTEKNPRVRIENYNDTLIANLSVTSNICSDSLKKNIYTHPIANTDVTIDSLICVGNNVTATATGDFKSIQWSPSQLFLPSNGSTTTASIKKSQYIYYTTYNIYNCSHTDSIYIFVQQKPYFYGAPDSLLWSYGSDNILRESATAHDQLNAGVKYNLNVTSIDGISYSWTPSDYLSCTDCPSPDIDLQCGATNNNCLDFPSYIEYTITMEDSLGCFTNDTTIRFSISIDTKIGMPEAFTPNGDGINDIAFVRGWGIKEFIEVTIYNRWGQVVFESNDINNGWDGTFHGEAQGMDTFAYTIKYIDMHDDEQLVKGYITLIR